MSILNSNSLCINAFLLQRLLISVERVRWKVCSLFVFSVVSLLLSSWWWYFLFLVLPSLLNPFVLKFYSSGTKSRCLFFYVSMSRSCLISGHFFLCYVLASSCKLDFVYRCCSALFETSCEIVHCVQLIFIILLTTILLCKVSPSGVGKGAHPVCLNIFFRLFGCSCSGLKNSMPYGWKTYWTSLAVTHLLLGCCFYARKISINI